MEELKKLLEMLEGKLTYAKRLIAEYDDTMDYASHCNLLGFAEGIEFVMEEIEEMLTEKGKGKHYSEGRGKGKDEGKGKGIGKDKSEGKGKGRGAGRGKDEKKVKGKIRGKSGSKGRG